MLRFTDVNVYINVNRSAMCGVDGKTF